MNKPFILGVNGSSNKSGRVSRMLKVVMGGLEKSGARTATVYLANKKIFPHSGRLDPKTFIEKTRDDMPYLQKLVLETDGVIFATPTHWFNVSSLMKIFLDGLTSLEHHNFLMEGKAAAIISYGPQGGALNAATYLLAVVNQMGMIVPPHAMIFDEGRSDVWAGKKELALLAKNILQQIQATKRPGLNWGYPGAKYKVSPIELIPKKRFNRK